MFVRISLDLLEAKEAKPLEKEMRWYNGCNCQRERERERERDALIHRQIHRETDRYIERQNGK